MKYIRPASVRVHASCTDEAIKVCAFIDDKGLLVTVVVCPGDKRRVRITGLKAGTYGLSLHTTDGSRQPGSIRVEDSKAVLLDIPAKSVTTIFQNDFTVSP
jgi:hypothetical protein